MLPRTVIVGWGLGSLGLAVILNTFNVLLIAYLTLVVGIEPALAGSLVLMAKLYDVATDLPMGWLTDRTRSRWGARRPYMFVAAFVTPVALYMMFSPPAGDKVVYILASLVIYATGYTLFNVPYLSMPAEMSRDTHLRTKMVAWRSLFIAAGTLFGVSIAPFLIGFLGGGAHAYAMLGKVMAATVAAAFLACVVTTSRHRVAEETRVAVPLSQQVATIAANKHFRTLLMIKVTHLLALSIGAGSSVFFYRYVLGYDLKVLGLYGAVTTVVWALAMPVWTRIARNRGKRFGYFVATLAYSLLTLSWVLAGPGESMFTLLGRGVLFGIVAGGMLLMGNAMLQDIMDEDYRRTGHRKNGMFAGSYSLVEKLTSGLGAQILGLILSATGFVRSATVQTELSVQGIYLVVAIIPAGLMLLSLLLIHRYNLQESQLTG
ncbi:MAG: MFS transporter [Gammaproteobacteria bacterium]|nr:MFS transporter [Gammaproteobacteria bacterium]